MTMSKYGRLSETQKVELCERIKQFILREPLPTKLIAERFNVHPVLVRKLAKELGIKLPKSEYPAYRQRKSESTGN